MRLLDAGSFQDKVLAPLGDGCDLLRLSEQAGSATSGLMSACNAAFSDREPLQFEWAWNAPYKSRHLRQLDSDNKPAARFPKAIGTGPEARIRVLQAMLATAPWRRYPLKVMLFSEDARDIWNRCARGELYKKGSKKWTPTGGNTEDLSLVDVSERFAGVDGHRLVRRGLGDATERTLSVADGTLEIDALRECD